MMNSVQQALIEVERYDGELTVTRVIYEAPDASFAVIVGEDEGGWVHAAGPLAHLEAGQRARIVGRWEQHRRHGRQVRAEAAYELDPVDVEGARRYLVTIPHVGKSRAEALIEAHGEQVLEAIDSDPEAAFSRLRGVGRGQAEKAAEAWREKRAVRDLYVLLAPHGAGWLAEPLRRRHGPEAIAIVRRDPYRLTEEHGVGFQRADAIARAHGVAEDAPSRGRAAVVHVLGQAESRGHTNLPRGELEREATALVGDLDPQTIAQLEHRDAVIAEDGRVALSGTWRAEQELADRFVALVEAEAANGPAPEVEPDQELSDGQQAAAARAFESCLSVVTGGPGTGKTTLVAHVVRLARAARLGLELCAPTGRAARRLEEATGHPAHTIHRLLEWAPGEGPGRFAEHPLECDLLVVDESSMLSLEVAAMLMDAVGEGTHVVLIGDADQLPPVGAGRPFADLIASQRAPVTRLTHVFRQAARSMIVRAAHSINEGERPSTKPSPELVHDFFFASVEDTSRASELIVELASERLPSHYGIDPIAELQVLAPIYRGGLGVDGLNLRLREALNAQGQRIGETGHRVGDKLIQTRNDYETGLMNGQIAIVRDGDEDGGLDLDVDDGRRVRVDRDRVQALRAAYAISVHKAQGCEVPVVVIALDRSHSVLLSRNLLYTAVTRARSACVLVGQPRALDLAVRRAESFRRHTRLTELLA